MFEARLLEKFMRLDNWNDTSVYKDHKTGRIIPETLYFMMAIKGYYNKKETDDINKSSGGGMGKASSSTTDYEREF